MTSHRFLPTTSIIGAIIGASLIFSACGGDGTQTVTVQHGAVPKPVYIDLGEEGASVGDQRIFHFDGTSNDITVSMDWVMTTTGIDSPEAGVETRVTNAVMLFGGLDDSLLLEGTGWYPGGDATFKVSSTLVRAIIGGTGKYAGARGWVESTRNDDDSWTHVFHIE